MAAWIAAGIAIGLAVLYALRNSVVAPIVVARADEALQRELGLALTVDEVGGGWWSDLELRGVSLRAVRDGGALREVRIGGASVRYDLRALLRGELAGLQSVSANAVGLRIDASGSGGGGASDWAMPERFPALAVEGFDLDVELVGGRALRLRDANVRSQSAEERDDVEVAAPLVSFEGDWGIALDRESVALAARYRAGTFTFSKLDLTGDLAAHARSARLALGPTTELDAHLDVWGGELEAATRFGAFGFEGRVARASVELEPLLAFVASRFDLPLSGRASVAGEVLVDERGAWSAAHVELTDACVEGWSADRAELELVLRPDALEIVSLAARSRAASVGASAATIPFDRADLLDTLRGMRGELAVEAWDLPVPAGLALEVRHLAAAGRLDDAGVAFDSGALETRTGRFAVRRGRVSWSPRGEPLVASSTFDVDLSADFDDLAEIGPLFDDRRWAGSLAGTLHLSGKLEAPVGELDLRGANLVLSGYPIGELSAKARTDGRTLAVETLSARGELAEVQIEGEYDLVDERFERAHWRAGTTDLGALFPEWMHGGSLQIDAEVSGPLRSPSGAFTAASSGLEVEGLPAIGSLRLAGNLGPDLVRFDSVEARAEGVEVSWKGTLRHSQWALPLALELEQASMKREGVLVELEEPCTVRVAPHEILLESFELASGTGRARGSFAARGADWNGRAVIERFDPMPLLAPFLAEGAGVGEVGGDFELGRRASRWSGSGKFTARELRLAPDVPAFDLELAGAVGGDRVRVERFEARSEAGISVRASGEAPFDDANPLELRAGTLQASFDGSIDDVAHLPLQRLGFDGSASGSLRIRGTLAGAKPDLRGWVEVEGSGLRTTPSARTGVMAALAFEDARLSARAVLDGDLRVERMKLETPGALSLDVEGTALTAAAARAWLAGDVNAWRASAVDLRAKWAMEDVSFLSGALAGVRRVGGASSGELAAGGTWAEPDLRGRVALSRGELRLDTQLPPFEMLELAARFEGTRLVLERGTGELGAGPFELGGSIDFGGERASFDLDLSGRELLLVQRREVRLRADANLELVGPVDELVLRGDLRTRDGRFVTYIDWYRSGGAGSQAGRDAAPPLFSIPDGPLAAMRFDLHLRGGDPFRFETNLARGSLRADLTLAGTGRAPQLSGALFFETAKVFLSGTELELQSGTVTLDRRRPLSPDLDFTLAARVRGYAITAHVEGTYEEPVVELSSTPPLAGDDVLALLLTQRAPGATFEGDAGLEAAETVIVYLGKDLVSRVFGAESSVAERVEWQVGADVTQGGSSTAQLRIRVLGPSYGEGRALYVRGERDVYDRINYGLRFVLRLR